MSPKILALIAMAIVLSVGGAIFVYGSLGGTADTSSDGSNATSVTDEDDSEDDDSGTWKDSGVDVVVDAASGLTLTYVSGTEQCYTITQNTSTNEYTVTFSGITEDTIYMISGTLTGNIVINVSEDCDFKLGLNGVTVESSYSAPISCTSGNNFVLAAIEGTENTVTDNRAEQTSTDAINSSIYSVCDLKIQGSGTLTLVSENNNGVHTKGDLRIRNLTLTVTCVDNALKGNDSVSIKSGTITLTAESGDGIVTTSTDLNSNGVQRGTVTINSNKGDTVLVINSYCDGIDAAYDVIIE